MNDFLIRLRMFNLDIIIHFWETSFLQNKFIIIHNHYSTFSRYQDSYSEKGKKIYIKIPFTKKTIIIKAFRLKIITN